VYSYCPNQEKGLATTSVHRVQKNHGHYLSYNWIEKTELDSWNISVQLRKMKKNACPATFDKNACPASLEKYAEINKQNLQGTRMMTNY